MSRVRRAVRAESDIEKAADYIARDSNDAALRFLEQLDQKLELLADFPGMGTARNDLAKGIRSHPIFSYLMFYRPTADGIMLVRLIHGAMSDRRKRRLLRP